VAAGPRRRAAAGAGCGADDYADTRQIEGAGSVPVPGSEPGGSAAGDGRLAGAAGGQPGGPGEAGRHTYAG